MDELKDQVIAVLLPAAGQGSRMGQPVNKLFLETAGEAVIVHTVRKVAGFAHSLQESPITAGKNNYTRVHLTLITREDEETVLLGIYAYKRTGEGENCDGSTMIDLTGKWNDRFVQVTLPEGMWRVCFLYRTRRYTHNKDYIDMLTPESVRVLIDAV